MKNLSSLALLALLVLITIVFLAVVLPIVQTSVDGIKDVGEALGAFALIALPFASLNPQVTTEAADEQELRQFQSDLAAELNIAAILYNAEHSIVAYSVAQTLYHCIMQANETFLVNNWVVAGEYKTSAATYIHEM